MFPCDDVIMVYENHFSVKRTQYDSNTSTFGGFKFVLKIFNNDQIYMQVLWRPNTEKLQRKDRRLCY